jgi:hypothetical protein
MPHPVSPPPPLLPQEMWTNMKSDGRLSSRPRERSIGQPNNMPVLVRSRAVKKTKNKTKTERESSFPLNLWVVDKDLYSYFFKSWSRWREEEARRQSKASQLDNCWEWSASFSGAGPEFQLTLSHCWQMKKRNDVSGREPREKNLLKKTKCWLKQQSPMQICRRSERKKKSWLKIPPQALLFRLPSIPATVARRLGKPTREVDQQRDCCHNCTIVAGGSATCSETSMNTSGNIKFSMGRRHPFVYVKYHTRKAI